MIIVVGCGGTGSNLLPMLSRMMDNETFLLVDGDDVEEKNVIRQSFQTFDTGYNKARAMAKKLNSNFPNKHLFLDKYLENKEELLNLINITNDNERLYLCGCVDNNSSRLILEEVYDTYKNQFPNREIYYIDSGNEADFGTILINLKRSDFIDMSEDDHPLHHCSQLIAEKNSQQYQINLDMALAIAKVVFAIENGNEYPECIKINGFNRIAE